MIPADAAVFGPDALDQIAAGKYARRHMRFISSQLQPGDRFLNIGGEAGVVVLQALYDIPDLVAIAQHRRLDIARVSECLATRNGLMDSARLKITDGPLVFANDGQDEASGFMAYLRDFRPSVLRLCDRDVTPHALANIPQDRLRRIILPMELFCKDAPQEVYAEVLASIGFGQNETWQDRGMLVFDFQLS